MPPLLSDEEVRNRLDKLGVDLLGIYQGNHTLVRVCFRACGHIRDVLPSNTFRGRGCLDCVNKAKERYVQMPCSNCGRMVARKRRSLYKNKSERIFCNNVCAATYNNLHKAFGCRRSKLEIWMEEQLQVRYPTLKILFNSKRVINAELDIYFPDLKLAFEINGIFHYKPIYGAKVLAATQLNDHKKRVGCVKMKIKLYVIDVSTMKQFRPSRGQPVLDKLVSIINKRLLSKSISIHTT